MEFILAHSRYRRHKFQEAIALCDQMLAVNNRDEAAWVLKCQCLVKENLIDELQTEEEGIAELMIKEDQTNKFARAGTSFKGGVSNNSNPVLRPVTSGRINTGFQRAGTSVGSRAGSRNNMLRTGRVMTKGGVPTTANGRVLRLATASLEQYGQNFFDSAKADLKKLSQRRSKARLIFQYLFYVEHNIKKCLELAVYATEANGYADPWWKLALGKCYYHLGIWQEGERQLLSSSAGHNHSVTAFLYLSKIYEKQDNVQRAVAVLEEAKKTHAFEPKLDIAIGRIYDQLNDLDRSHECYKRALSMQNCNIEAVANMAAYYFYREQPQIALKLYQRLIELGYQSPQIWNNLALCCFANHQYQHLYSCIQRGLATRDDPLLTADLWYNIGYIYTLLGEKDMAVEAYRLAVAHRPDHAEALNNLAVIEASRGKVDAAINYAQRAHREWPGFESAYNLSLWYFKTNQLQKASNLNMEALRLYPGHAESRELRTRLLRKLDSL